jgi:hypothetical protein
MPKLHGEEPIGEGGIQSTRAGLRRFESEGPEKKVGRRRKTIRVKIRMTFNARKRPISGRATISSLCRQRLYNARKSRQEAILASSMPFMDPP